MSTESASKKAKVGATYSDKLQAWELARNAQRRQADETIQKVASEIRFEGNEAKVDSFETLYEGNWFISLNDIPDHMELRCQDDADSDPNPKQNLRTVDFVLQDASTLQITDDEADISELFPDDADVRGKKFVRLSMSIPHNGFPAYGTSRTLCPDKDEKGILLTATVPINFGEFWQKKSRGYQKYGPTFVQFLDSFELSTHPKDKLKVLHKDMDKYMIVPMVDKTRLARPLDGIEKVVVRGNHKLENLQHQKIIFQRKSEGQMFFEAMDAYIEDVTLEKDTLDGDGAFLTLKLLVPHEDHLNGRSMPFGPKHDCPEKFHHHHNTYGRVYNVEPMAGCGLIDLAGADKCITMPKGTVLENTFIWCMGSAAAGCAAAAGIAAAGASVAVAYAK